MPNATTHEALGAISGAAATSYFVAPFVRPHDQENGKPALLMTGLVGGGVGGRVPDLLEPPVHPNHRSFCHSFVVGCAVVGGVALTVRALHELRERQTRTRTSSGLAPPREDDESSSGITLKNAVVAGIVVAVLVGIISHLVADSGTPSGLPLIR